PGVLILHPVIIEADMVKSLDTNKKLTNLHIQSLYHHVGSYPENEPQKTLSLADNFRHNSTGTPQSHERVYRMIEASVVLDITRILSRLEYVSTDKSNIPCVE
ncbi:MAG: hypothetical protein U9Q76_08230, partial [candidate division WOR-3 bacterium]|nr:hypothetical protein [candidate division WOR-3 bacterium]